ncbi:TM2 domain protein [Anatilimnocola aggregata]|uniref:TM2 domain protein n=1 Tax=Anatilimnocola aggregata TaxID=2528021 RepID=A0A517Y590_9BACT|nr:NINE protein [Anatilimnocola aggregata]QDU25366.1 TM2 domain protein [Anatilimnocola aggregata]
MPVEAACPSCDGKFRLPDTAAGKKIRCPKCKGPLEVPPLSAAEDAAAPTSIETKPEPAAPQPAALEPTPPAASTPAGKTVEANCPSCSGKFRLPEAAAGKKIRCPKCKGPLEVPPLGATSSPTAPASTEGLKSAWRAASQEPAPTEMLKAASTKPAAELPAIEKPLPEKPPAEKVPAEKTQPTKVPVVEKPVAEKEKVVSKKPVAEKPRAEKPQPEKAPPAKKPAQPTAEVVTTAPASNKLKFIAPEPTVPQWFFRGEDGEAFGPVDRPTLDAWKEEGRISVDCQVLQQGSEQWQWASDLYPELEEAEEEPAPSSPADNSEADESADLDEEAASADTSFVSKSKSRSEVATTRRAVDEESEPNEERLSPHSKPVAFLLALTLGWLGIHRFYLGHVSIGLAMLFTCGGLFIWSITDALRILFGHVTDSEGLKLRD